MNYNFSDKFVECGGQAAELLEDDLASDPKSWILDPCSYLGRENVDDDSENPLSKTRKLRRSSTQTRVKVELDPLNHHSCC